MITPVLLATDVLLWILILMIGVTWYFLRHDQLFCGRWRALWQRPLAASCGVILSFFALIAWMDSLHYTQPDSVKVYSVLDWVLSPIGDKNETTYSAPLALHAYVKQNIEQPNGQDIRDYPRLLYAGQSILDPVMHEQDLRQRFVRAGWAWGCATLILWLMGQILLMWRGKRKWDQAWIYFWQGKSLWPLRTLLGVSSFILLCICLFRSFAFEYHLFGTDKTGIDVFYQTVKSIRTGLLMGTLTTLITLPFAISLGMMAGYFRGKTDDIIQYVYTVLSSIPAVLLIAASVLLLQSFMNKYDAYFTSALQRSDLRLLALCVILGISSWTSLCRIIRAETLKISQLEYVQAAITLGASPTRILMKHVLPNIMHLIIIISAIDFSGLVLAEAVLSYVGVGVDPTTYSWGNMINEARLELAREPMVWWCLAAAFAFMFALVLAANLFADELRDVFDPRLGLGGR